MKINQNEFVGNIRKFHAIGVAVHETNRFRNKKQIAYKLKY